MAETQNYEVFYDIRVDATEGTRQVTEFANAVEKLSKGRASFAPVITNINEMMQAVERTFRGKNRKKRDFNYDLNIRTGETEARLERVKTLLGEIQTLTQGIRLVINPGEKIDGRALRNQTAKLLDKKKLEEQREEARQTAASAVRSVMETQRTVTRSIGKVNAALAHLEKGREIRIKTDAARTRLQEILSLLGNIRGAVSMTLNLNTALSGSAAPAGLVVRPPYAPSATAFLLPEKEQEKLNQRLYADEALSRQRMQQAREKAALQVETFRQMSDIRAAEREVRRREAERARADRELRKIAERTRREQEAAEKQRIRAAEQQRRRNAAQVLSSVRHQAAQEENVYGSKRLAVLLLAGCQRDELVGTTPDKDMLNFRVGMSGEWDCVGAAAVTDSIKNNGTPEAGKSSPAGATTVRAFSMDEVSGAGPLYLHTSVADTIASAPLGGRKAGTRSTPVGDNDSFYKSFGIFGYLAEDWSDDIRPEYFYNVKVEETDGGFWEPEGNYYWPGRGLYIWAYAPYNLDGLTLPGLADEPYFTYDVPSDVEKQKDLLIAEPEKTTGNPAGGTLELKFRHVLTAVRFVTGDDIRPGSISSIAIKNVRGNGTYGRGDTEWSFPKGAILKTFTCEFDENDVDEIPDVQIHPDEATFMRLPQMLPDKAQVEVRFTDRKGGGTYTLTADIGSTQWPMGSTVTYRISMSSICETSTFEIKGPENTITYEGGEGTFTVTSYTTVSKDRYPDRIIDEPWTVEFSVDDGSTWSPTKPQWLSVFQGNGTGGTHTYDFTVMPQTCIEKNPHNETLRQAEPISNGVYDLSTKGGTTAMNTANCYIINSPGTYKLPLVYGNAIKNSETNCAAYISQKNGKDVLQNLVNHLDKEIKDPYIYKNEDCQPKKAVLVWQDEEGLITSVSLADNNTYLQFETAAAHSEAFRQGNAVVAVLDNNDKIMWSWHIWVTDYVPEQQAVNKKYDPTETPRDRVVTNHQGTQYTLMGVYIGWCDGITMIYDARTVKVRFTQTATGKMQVIELTQQAHTSTKDGDCTFFQQGRKDPIVGNGKETCCFSKPEYQPRRKVGKVSLGVAIQNPYLMYDYDNNGPESWCSDTYSNLWNMKRTKYKEEVGEIEKTIYDPSPVGYCIPNYSVFSGITYNGDNITYQWSFDKINSPYTSYADIHSGWEFYCNKMSGQDKYDPSGGTIFFPFTYMRSGRSFTVNEEEEDIRLWLDSSSPRGGLSNCVSILLSSTYTCGNLSLDINGYAVRPVKEVVN